MNPIAVINYKYQRVLTTQRLAESFGTEQKVLSNNFKRNFERFVTGVHYYKLEGVDLQEFKGVHQNDETLKFVSIIYLWTKRGAAHHAKMLNTDEAWAIYEELEESYFNQKQTQFQVPQSFAEALRLAADMAEQNESLKLANAQQNQIICELKPKATYYDLILQSKAAIPISQIAKDYGMSAKRMNDILHELKIQFKQGDTWLLYQEHANMGYTSSKTHHYINDKDEQCSKLHTYWTQKGRLFIYDTLKRRKAILPMIERTMEQGVL